MMRRRHTMKPSIAQSLPLRHILRRSTVVLSLLPNKSMMPMLLVWPPLPPRISFLSLYFLGMNKCRCTAHVIS